VSLNRDDPDEGGAMQDIDLPDGNRSPDSEALQKEMMTAIDEAIHALPEQQRFAVILRRRDEFSYEEIATILKTSLPATKSLLFRARETLRLALKDYLNM
jgi:RNA polymerase sigma-70 factor (ECF subfamily)